MTVLALQSRLVLHLDALDAVKNVSVYTLETFKTNECRYMDNDPLAIYINVKLLKDDVRLTTRRYH